MSGLKQLIYTSQSETFADLKKMQRLVVQSRENNLKREITGALLQDQQSIIQVLEGTTDSVNALFAKILRDPRHTDVVLIMERPIAEREFGEWRFLRRCGVELFQGYIFSKPRFEGIDKYADLGIESLA